MSKQLESLKVYTTTNIEIKEEKKEKLKASYIVYDVKERMKKKFITTISGLTGYKIDAKDFSKKCSKKFACSCNVVD